MLCSPSISLSEVTSERSLSPRDALKLLRKGSCSCCVEITFQVRGCHVRKLKLRSFSCKCSAGPELQGIQAADPKSRPCHLKQSGVCGPGQSSSLPFSLSYKSFLASALGSTSPKGGYSLTKCSSLFVSPQLSSLIIFFTSLDLTLKGNRNFP